ncbi:caspase, EACC1-associated type [Herbidospora galbida]|uniref:caspase, EACC1-associated type n=1 Tax=Herbidospora galbida TaxID=2575442 RepID=UPI001485A2E6|nr:caspase family protein [Herbidospora galbida]
MRVLVVGSGTHAAGSRIADIPAVPRTVADLGRCLVERAGLDPAGLEVLADPADPRVFGEVLVRNAAAARDVFVLYFVGHGLVGADRELYLATNATRDLTAGIAAHQALPFSVVREALAECPAPLRVVVLDCCSSGRAGGGLPDVVVETADQGMFLLAAADRDQAAWAREGDPYTTFTGALIEVLTTGDPAAPHVFTLDDVFRSMSGRLATAPRRLSTDYADRRPFAPNPARRRSFSSGASSLSPDAASDPSRCCSELADGMFSPYRGLAPFGPRDADVFFGRESLTNDLLDRVAEALPGTEPLIVVGPSGVGKSSLLHAGLVPALRHLAEVVTLSPARDLDLSSVHPSEGRPVVVVVDQFEQIFVTDVEARRAEFICDLGALAGTPNVVVVIGVRADFFGHCAAHPELVPALRRPVVVSPMTANQLRDAIEKPAHLAGLHLQEGLVDLLLEDFSTGVALPLLSHALLATWQDRENGTLTLTGYRAAGGVAHAVAQTADRTLNDLDLTDRTIARRLLVRLVRLGEGAPDTRRRLPLTALDDSTRAVLDRFVAARLVTADRDGVEIAHEILIRSWPQLRDWLDADRTSLLVEQQLTEAARHWDAENRDPGGLYRGARLALARQTAGASAALDPLARLFLGASIDHDLAQQRATIRRLRRRNLLAAVLGVLLLTTAAAGGFGLVQLQAANDAALTASARSLLGEALAVGDRDRGLALRFTATAHALQPSDEEARAALMRNLLYLHAMPITTVKGFNPHGAVVSEDGYRALTNQDGEVLVWDLSDSRRIRSHRLSADLGAGYELSLDATGTHALGAQTIPASNSDGVNTALTYWDLTDLTRPRAYPLQESADSSGQYRAKLSGDGRSALTGNWADPGPLTYWDLNDPQHPRAYPLSVETVASISLSADGNRALVAGLSTVALWDMTDPARPRRHSLLREAGSRRVSAIELSPDGQRAVTSREITPKGANDLVVWDLADPSRPRKHLLQISREAGTLATDFSANASYLLVADSYRPGAGSGTILLWNLRNFAKPRHHLLPTSIAPEEHAWIQLNSDGTLAMTAKFKHDGSTGSLHLWDLTNPEVPLGVPLPEGVDPSQVSSLSENGRRVLVGGYGDTANMWEIEKPSVTPIPLPVRKSMGTVFDVEISADGTRAITIGRTVEENAFPDYAVTLWNLVGSRPRPHVVIPMTKDTSFQVALSGDGTAALIESAVPQGEECGYPCLDQQKIELILWDLTDPAVPRSHPILLPHQGGSAERSANRISVRGDRALVAVGEQAMVIDLTDPVSPRLSPLPGSHPRILELSEDGSRAVTGGRKGAMLWVLEVSGHPRAHPVEAAEQFRLSPDGRRAFSFAPANAKFWDLTDPAAPTSSSLRTTRGDVWDAVLNSDGTKLLTSSRSHRVALWDISDPTTPQALPLPVPETWDSPYEVSLDSAGLRALTSDYWSLFTDGPQYSGSVTLWDFTALSRPLDSACAITGHGLTKDEWTRYLPAIPHHEICPQ